MTVESTATNVAIHAASKLIEKASPAIFGRLSERLSKEVLKIRVQFTQTFQDHVAKCFDRCLNVKTVISRDEPIDLESIYVPLTLRSGLKEHILDYTADPSAQFGAKNIISGTGGAGKTVLMKHLVNISKASPLNLVPIFIELRNVEFDRAESFEDCAFNHLKLDGGKESRALFDAALEESLFVFYLDGFDEIHPEESEKALELIRRFSEKYKQTSILITTRPKTGIETLRQFKVYHVEPLTKKSAISLIEKTTFDQITKQKFISEMRKGLFEKHSTLMSLPILVSMMLLSFRTYADIPDRMTVFYAQAFETLYSIHDSENKELYKRVHHAGLSPDIFKNVLETFCYLSLSNHDIEFTESTLSSYIHRSLKIANLDVSPEKFKNDLIHNVCVIQPDGLNYVFVHRSFQEYFASLFSLKYSGDKKFDVIDKIVDVSGSAVLTMLLELDSVKTKRQWMVQKVKDFLNDIQKVSRSKSFYKKWSYFLKVIYVENDTTSYALGNIGNENFRLMSILEDHSGSGVGLTTIVTGLRLPARDEFISRGIEPQNRPKADHDFSMGICYDREEFFPIDNKSLEIFMSTGYVDNFHRLHNNIRSLYKSIEQELEEQSRVEEQELFP